MPSKRNILKKIRGSVKPVYWTDEECKTFGKLCRSHNVAILQNQYDSMDILYNKSSAFLE